MCGARLFLFSLHPSAFILILRAALAFGCYHAQAGGLGIHHLLRPLRILSIAFLWLVFANATVYWIVAVCLGGDAWSGRVESGHHYLANHRRLTEVSASVWNYSKVHTISVMISCPMAILAFFTIAIANERKRKEAGRG